MNVEELIATTIANRVAFGLLYAMGYSLEEIATADGAPMRLVAHEVTCTIYEDVIAREWILETSWRGVKEVQRVSGLEWMSDYVEGHINDGIRDITHQLWAKAGKPTKEPVPVEA